MAKAKLSRLKEIEKDIYSLFAEVASFLGYSEIHGRIVAALLVKGGKASLQEIAKETGYSPSMISLSLDFLEFFEIIKKVKRAGDRKLYIELQGDLVEALRKVFVSRLERSLSNTLKKFESYRRELKGNKQEEALKILKAIEVLEEEIKRLKKFMALIK